jgi:hypothetical protein
MTLVCLAVLNAFKNTKINDDHLEAVKNMKRFVKVGGFSLPDDE